MTTKFTNGKKEVTFFLIDDDDVDRQSIIRSFQKEKIANTIVEAVNGEEGLKKLRGDDANEIVKKPYIILLDLNMPKMGGIEFLQEIRKSEDLKDSIVFVLSTSNDDKDKVDAYNLNVAGYIVKDNVGKNFMNLIAMLDCYWRVVEFP